MRFYQNIKNNQLPKITCKDFSVCISSFDNLIIMTNYTFRLIQNASGHNLMAMSSQSINQDIFIPLKIKRHILSVIYYHKGLMFLKSVYLQLKTSYCTKLLSYLLTAAMNLQLMSYLCLPLELEQSYEIKRTERKNRKSRGRPPKRARRDKEVSGCKNMQFAF